MEKNRRKTWKKITALVLTGIFSTSAMTYAQIPQMSLEEYPIVDCSLACVPMCEELAKLATGCTDAEAEATIHFSNTNPCYRNLASGNRDLILAYEPAESTKEDLKEYAPLNMQAVGQDALVFLVNADNPVDSLTEEELISIFTGKIRNWREVGGNDEEIKVFRRPEESGSQTLLRSLLIGEAEMPETITELVDSMEGMFHAMMNYDNSANSIGFSVYYYTDQMMGMDDIKILCVDNVAPTNETILSGEYKLVNPFYCATNDRSSENAKKIQEWLLSEEGQEFIESCGYVRMPSDK